LNLSIHIKIIFVSDDFFYREHDPSEKATLHFI